MEKNTVGKLRRRMEIIQAQQSFSIFSDRFKYTPPEFPPAQMHRDWENLLQDAYGRVRGVLILGPRSGAKSERVTINYPSWMIGKDHNLRISVVSTPSDKSVKFLGKIVNRIEGDETYREIFGNIKPSEPKVWRTDAVTVIREIDSPEASLSAIGTMGQAVSKRADIIVVDDPLDSENTKTDYLRQSMIRWFNDALMPTLEPKGLCICIMTPWHEDDLSQYIMKQPGWIVMRYPVIMNAKENLPKWLDTDDPKLTVWPEKYGYPIRQFDHNGAEIMENGKPKFISLLRDIYNKNVDTFMCQYLLDPFSVTGTLFNEDWITWYDAKDVDWRNVVVFQGWDLNIVVTERSDYSACATVAYDGVQNIIYVLEIFRARMTPLEQYAMVIKKYDEYREHAPVRQVTIESDAYQKSLSMGLIANTNLPIVPSESKGRAKEDRIGLLSPHFQNHRIRLPKHMYGGEFMNEYKRFPRGSNDDQLDALHKCLEPILMAIGGNRLSWGSVDMI